jgi:Fe-S-cluster containining protein
MNADGVSPRSAIPVPDSARVIHDEIVAALRAMLRRPYDGPLCSRFRADLHGVLSLFERYQETILSHGGLKAVCTRGCRYCCFHWPEDVYSFEGEIAADFIARHLPAKMATIAATFREDERELERLEEIVTLRLREPDIREQLSEEDQVELLLASYYRLERPCALLDHDGACGIYPVRPLSCRIYYNFSDPFYCVPSNVDESNVRTYLLDLEEEASELLDALHERFERHGGVTGLRPLLARLLEERLLS